MAGTEAARPADAARAGQAASRRRQRAAAARAAGVSRTGPAVAVCLAALAVVFAAGLPLAVSHREWAQPADVLAALDLLVRWCAASLFDQSALPALQQQIAALPAFYGVRDRALLSLLTMGAAVLLAVSGSIYQLVFRNPIAAPTMLGVSNGVNLGVLVLVVQFGSAAYFHDAERYLYCAAGAVGVLVAVAGLALLVSGRRGFSVLTLLLVASIVSQVLGMTIGYLTATLFDDALLVVYQEVLSVLDVSIGPLAFAVLGAVLLVCLVPCVLLSFRLNALAFSEDEARLLGMDRTAAQVGMLALATVMIVASEVLVGTVSMVSLVVPFLARAFFGAEFRRQLLGNVLIAPPLLLACRTIADAIPFVGLGMPIGIVVNFVLLPFYVAVVVKGQRTWQ